MTKRILWWSRTRQITGKSFAKARSMVYGTSVLDVARRLAVYVDQILKGAHPGDLQSQDSQSRSDYHPALAARPRRRGNRITTFFTAAQNVCFWHKADIRSRRLLPRNMTV